VIKKVKKIPKIFAAHNTIFLLAINLFITKVNQISPIFNDQSPKNENNKTI